MLILRWILFLVLGVPLLVGILLAVVFAALHFSVLVPGPARAVEYVGALLLGVPVLLIAIYATVQWSVCLFARGSRQEAAAPPR